MIFSLPAFSCTYLDNRSDIKSSLTTRSSKQIYSSVFFRTAMELSPTLTLALARGPPSSTRQSGTIHAPKRHQLHGTWNRNVHPSVQGCSSHTAQRACTRLRHARFLTQAPTFGTLHTKILSFRVSPAVSLAPTHCTLERHELVISRLRDLDEDLKRNFTRPAPVATDRRHRQSAGLPMLVHQQDAVDDSVDTFVSFPLR